MPDRPASHRLDDPVLDHAHRDYARVYVTDAVGEALARAQRASIESRVVYFYVVDGEGRLQGVVPTRRLLLNPPETPVADLMVRQVIALPQTATLLDACELFILHRLLAFPVVDEHRRILGIIDVEAYTDQVSDLARREESDDIFQLIGLHLAEVRSGSLPGAFRGRIPWLLCNVGGGLACALLGAVFEDVLDQVIVLALFIPVVLALAESVSVQSLSLTLQMHEPQAPGRGKTLGLLRRELIVGLLLGLACGAMVGLAAWAWQRMAAVALCILLSIAVSVASAAVLGFGVPTALRAIERDPKVASGPITLAIVDVVTLTTYLGLATAMLT